MSMTKCKRATVVVVALVMLLQAPAAVTGAIDNVAFQWTNVLNQLMCAQPSFALTSSVQATLHLAQWHALLALKQTGGDTTEEAVVAFASFKILAHYFGWTQVIDPYIGPLLDRQIRTWKLSKRQQSLAKRLGHAVADSLLSQLSQRSPEGEFTLGPIKQAIDENVNPAVGVFRHFDFTPNTTAGHDAARFTFDVLVTYRPFVAPDALQFVKDYLSDLKPPVIPSKEWNENWTGLKDIARIDWPGRTAEMNLTANFYACTKVNTTLCNIEQRLTAAAQASLPNTTSLYDSVVLLAKMSVSAYDASIVHMNIKYGYWFWRPEQAYRAGDPKHAPIPNWTPFRPTPLEPEYPSGTVAMVAAGARALQLFFGKGVDVAFSIAGGGTFNCPGFVGDPIPARSYESIDAFVEEAMKSRLYSGAHFLKSVDDGKTVGYTVADYIEQHWAQTTPAGVLPVPTFLDILAKAPAKSGDFSPVKFDI